MTASPLVDDIAEITVAGCAIASSEGASLASSRLTGPDFHNQLLWDVISAASGLPDVRDDDTHWSEAHKLTDYRLVVYACAHRVELLAKTFERSWLVSLVTGRCVQADRSGSFARRIQSAAVTRRQVASHLEALEGLGVDLAALVAAQEPGSLGGPERALVGSGREMAE